MTHLTLALTGLLATSQPAEACGGFFCSQSQPVVQNAERIAFGIDEQQGVVEAHVQIFYEGPSDEFAWVVPVSSNPDVFVSTDQLFNVLSFQLAPIFQLNTIEEGNCGDGNPFPCIGCSAEMSLESNFAEDIAASGGVEVEQQGQVGPYDMVVLTATDSGELLNWLGEAGYDLPPQTDALLAPYISDGAHFLALKLSKDRDDGDIAPIGFRYEGTKPAVPIQLTALAAADDMRLETYVFSKNRAVPESYLHVQINHAAIDWWNFGQNYSDVITLAANEAGGHAFGTDFAGSPGFLTNAVLPSGWEEGDLRSAQNFEDLVQRAFNQGFFPANDVASALSNCVDIPANADPLEFIGCPSCFDYDGSEFDANVCTDLFVELVVDPRTVAEELFEHPWVSRMTSSLDAAEMTVDPVFVQNPDMGEVNALRQADFVFECKGGKARNKAKRRLELEDGRVIEIPSINWLDRNNLTTFEYIQELGEINAQVIEQTGASGAPVVLIDHTDALFDQVALFNGRLGCGGCSGTGGPAGGLAVLGLALLGLRRRN